MRYFPCLIGCISFFGGVNSNSATIEGELILRVENKRSEIDMVGGVLLMVRGAKRIDP